jgi:hypothetical protein
VSRDGGGGPGGGTGRRSTRFAGDPCGVGVGGDGDGGADKIGAAIGRAYAVSSMGGALGRIGFHPLGRTISELTTGRVERASSTGVGVADGARSKNTDGGVTAIAAGTAIPTDSGPTGSGGDCDGGGDGGGSARSGGGGRGTRTRSFGGMPDGKFSQNCARSPKCGTTCTPSEHARSDGSKSGSSTISPTT